MKDSKLITLITIFIFFIIFVIDCPAKGEKKGDYHQILLAKLPDPMASLNYIPDLPYSNFENDRYLTNSDRYRLNTNDIYYVDYNEPDQGVSGAGNSLKTLLDAIDMSKETVIIFSHHPENGDTTIYTFSTNIIVPSNIILEFQENALLNIDLNVTISIYSPENIYALPKQQIKSGKGRMFFFQAGNVHPGWWGTPLNGYTDSTSYWNLINDAIQPDSTIELFPNADYYINAAEGVTFSKKVHIKGRGARFICGPSVENNPTITITASESIIEHFEVDCSSNHSDMTGDNDFQDSGDNFSNNFRSAVKIRGDNTICRYLDIKTAVVGICCEGMMGGEIHHCCLMNSTITSNTSNANNYHAGIRIDDSTDLAIHDNLIDGYGQNILIGGSHRIERISIYKNKLMNASNNGIYISSGTEMEIWDNDVMSFDCTGIKVRDSYHNVHHNRIYCEIPSGAISGITITGNGYDDGDGFNGRDTIVNANIITGNANAGIMSGIHDGFSLKNPHIINNVINFDPAPTRPAYGIFFKGLSDGSIISGNMAVGGHSFGLLMNVNPNHFHDNTLITNNCFIGGSNDAFALVNLQNSFITYNQGKNCASGRSGLMLYNSTLNKAFNNDLGDDRVISTQGYGIEEKGLSDYNEYLNNYLAGVVKSEYYGLGLNSRIIGSENPTGPYLEKTFCNPFPGQGILPGSLSVPIDTSIIIKLKDYNGSDTDKIFLSVNGVNVNPDLKQINENNRDYWIIYHPAKDFNFDQIVNVKIDSANIYESFMIPYEYSFRIESLAEYNNVRENTPSSMIDESDQIHHKVIADSGTEIEGAKIIYDSFEPVKPRFGPLNELPHLSENDAIAVGCSMSIEPPTVFNNPVTIFIPCPGIDDLSIVKIYFYNPVIGWVPALEVDGWMIDDSRVNHPETTPPIIEIRINYSGVFQAGIPLNSEEISRLKNNNSIDGEESEIVTGAETGGCFINVLI